MKVVVMRVEEVVVMVFISWLGVQRRRIVGPDQPWQKPEIRSNLGHHLSLWDRCEPIPRRVEKSSQLWKEAHCMFLTLPPLPHIPHPSLTSSLRLINN